MSPESDRIVVPTNGRGPHSVSETAPAPSSGATGRGDAGAPTREEMSVAFSPKQLAIGFGIIASLVLLILGRARRRGPTDD